MTGITPNGWPYATPEDKRINWPATSQALASKLDNTMAATASRAYVDGRLNGNGSAIFGAKVTTGADGTVIWALPTGFGATPVVVATPAATADVVVRIIDANPATITFRAVFRSDGSNAPGVFLNIMCIGL